MTTSEGYIVTMEDWYAAGNFDDAAKVGDRVEEAIVDDFVNSLPPACMTHGYVQSGEPYSHEWDPEKEQYRPTFATFMKDGDHWIYLGHCFYKGTKHQQRRMRWE